MSRLIAGARTLVGHLAERLQADPSVQLWNGEVLPLGPAAPDDIRLTIRSPDVIARLLRSPRLMTLVELSVAGKLDTEGGSPADIRRVYVDQSRVVVAIGERIRSAL